MQRSMGVNSPFIFVIPHKQHRIPNEEHGNAHQYRTIDRVLEISIELGGS
jgi:hypothetical protein